MFCTVQCSAVCCRNPSREKSKDFPSYSYSKWTVTGNDVILWKFSQPPQLSYRENPLVVNDISCPSEESRGLVRKVKNDLSSGAIRIKGKKAFRSLKQRAICIIFSAPLHKRIKMRKSAGQANNTNTRNEGWLVAVVVFTLFVFIFRWLFLLLHGLNNSWLNFTGGGWFRRL